MAEQFWAACQTITGREHIVRAEIEKMERGAFLPTYVRSSISMGRLNVNERAAVPGYVFFRARHDDWSPVQDIDGVIGVLSNGDCAMRIKPEEIERLMIDHIVGTHNRLERIVSSGSSRRRCRKPRRSKRARSSSFTVP